MRLHQTLAHLCLEGCAASGSAAGLAEMVAGLKGVQEGLVWCVQTRTAAAPKQAPR